MRLSTFVPPLPAELLGSLEQLGIKTDSDLLFSDSSLGIYQKLLPTTISLHDITRTISDVAERAAAPALRLNYPLTPQNGENIQDSALASGVPELDELLHGFGGRRVIEISGDKGSGKTALATQIVLRHLAMCPQGGAFWIDTTGDFSVDGISTALRSYDGPGTSTALERLHVALVFDIHAAHDTLDTIKWTIEDSTEGSKSPLQIVVIDSITSILGPLLSPISSQGHAIMTTFMRQLKAFARAYGLTFLVINNATPMASSTDSQIHNPYSAFSTTVKKPALGPSFTFLTDTTLWLSAVPRHDESDDDSLVCVAEIFRSRTSPSRTWCTFKIRNGALLPYGE